MSRTDLKLDAPGTLPRPGPVGRLLRLGLGALCGYVLWQIRQDWPSLTVGDASVLAGYSLAIAAAAWISSYVINIGYSRNWGRRPLYMVVVLWGAAAAYGQLTTGGPFTPLLGWAITIWMIYVYSHLGLSFLLSALLATPGCEMRALHYLYQRITGQPVAEHYCPVGPLHPVDQWEVARRKRP